MPGQVVWAWVTSTSPLEVRLAEGPEPVPVAVGSATGLSVNQRVAVALIDGEVALMSP